MDTNPITTAAPARAKPIPAEMWHTIRRLTELRESGEITPGHLRRLLIEEGWKHHLSEQNLIDAQIIYPPPKSRGGLKGAKNE